MSIPYDDQPATTTEKSAVQIVRNWIILSAALAAVTMVFLLFFITNMVMYSQADIIDQSELIVNAWVCGAMLVTSTFASVLCYSIGIKMLIKMPYAEEE